MRTPVFEPQGSSGTRNLTDEAKKEVVQLKEDKASLTDRVGDLTRKKDELEAYLGGFAKKMFLMLEVTFPYPTDYKELPCCVSVTSTLFVCAEFC